MVRTTSERRAHVSRSLEGRLNLGFFCQWSRDQQNTHAASAGDAAGYDNQSSLSILRSTAERSINSSLKRWMELKTLVIQKTSDCERVAFGSERSQGAACEELYFTTKHTTKHDAVRNRSCRVPRLLNESLDSQKTQLQGDSWCSRCHYFLATSDELRWKGPRSRCGWPGAGARNRLDDESFPWRRSTGKAGPQAVQRRVCAAAPL